MTRSVRFLSLCLLVALVAGGCSREEGIEQYSVPKPWPVKIVVDPAENMPRAAGGMSLPQPGDVVLGAIILRGEQAWFFKTFGPPQLLGPHVMPIAQVIESVRFEADGTAAWTLGEGMKQLPRDANRFATITFGPNNVFQMSVTVLTKNKPDEPYLLDNINRWRAQMQLPPTTAEDLKHDISPRPLTHGGSAYFVLLGFDEQGPAAGPSNQGPSNQGPPTALTKYDTPTGWTDRGASGDRRASFVVTDGGKSVELVVTSFPAVGEMANPIENINRWRRQVQLAPQSPEEIAGDAKQISISGNRGVYIELFTPADAKEKQAILAAMCQVGSSVWFFKLSGDADLAKRESDNLKKFLESVRLEPQGATDGK